MGRQEQGCLSAPFLEAQGFHTLEFTDFVGYDAGFIKARRSVPPKGDAS